MKQIYKSKIKNKKCLCRYCDEYFLAAEPRASRCKKYKINKSLCECGNKKGYDTKSCMKCSSTTRGMIQSDIVKKYPKWKNCGHKKGELNVSKNINIRKKIKIGLRKYYKNNPQVLKEKSIHRTNLNINTKFGKLKYENNVGEKFRSKLEASFSNILNDNNIKYDYEVPIKMINDRYKVVDFVVNDILIEVSGYAYESWRKDFNNKIKILRDSVDNQIIILTYSQNLNKLYDITSYDIYTGSIDNKKDIINKINFCSNINLMKKELEAT